MATGERPTARKSVDPDRHGRGLRLGVSCGRAWLTDRGRLVKI